MPEWHGKGQHYRRKTRPREAAQFAKNIAAIAGQANKVKRPHRAPRARPLGTKRPADQTSADSAEITGLVSIRLNLAIGAAAHQRAPHACRCDILARMSRKRWSYRLSRPIPVKDGPTLRTLDDVQGLCSTTFPKKTKRGGHGRRHVRYCSLLLMAWPTSERPHVKSSLRYFSRPSGWRNDREALGSSSVQARQRSWPARCIVHRDPTAWLG